MRKKERLPALKRFGQNFLHDTDILHTIVTAAEVTPTDTVLEIGTGNGILTQALAERAGEVISVEIDRGRFDEVAPGLQEQFKNVRCIQGDFLEQALTLWQTMPGAVKIVANIPYNITTPIIENCILNRQKVERAVLMVQKEVAERLTAKPGTSGNGSLSVYVQYYFNVQIIAPVPRHCFHPIPNVDSAIIRLTPWSRPPVTVSSEELFFKIIRGAFWGKRKTLRNSLKQSPYTHYTDEMLEQIVSRTGIDLTRRGETLTMEEFAELSKTVVQLTKD